MVRQLISRANAAALNLPRYYTGRPCQKADHDSERYVCDGKCCECARLKQTRRAVGDPESKRRREREYYAANTERMRRLIRRRGRRYYANHKEQERTRLRQKGPSPGATGRYLARKRAATPRLSREERVQMRALYVQARRLTSETGIRHNVDHIVPLIRGGLNHPANMRVVTEAENLKKGIWLLEEIEQGIA